MKKSLNEMVREESSKNVGRYNFCKNKEALILHHNVCKRLTEIADEYNFPMGVLVYIAVGTSAHKTSVFEKGYSKIYNSKALHVIKLCDIIAKKFGEEYRTNDKVVHSMSRFYDLGGKQNKLRKVIKNVDTLPKFDTAKKFMAFLFKDDAEFSKGGYVNLFK